MSCSPFDLRDYFFGELPEEHRRRVDLHTKSCAVCREELTQLRSTQTALLSLADEEIPQRIGFVSDKVFEPSGWGRVWQAFWGSSARLGFASAAVLSIALVAFTFYRPAAAPAASDVTAARVEAAVAQRVAAAVDKAVAETETRQARRTADLLSAAEQRFEQQRQADMQNVAERFSVLEKRYNVERLLMARNDFRGEK